MASRTSLRQKRTQKSLRTGKTEVRLNKRKQELEDLHTLEAAVADLDLKSNDVTVYADLPLSRPTASGLQASHFHTLTDVQQRAIPLGLKGRDILGAAKTGSGKTLAFLVPVLERLYRAQWTELDGLGALIISPTRELAVQIFEVLRKVGRHHSFSAGLVIGGKSLKEEAERLSRMNILVCTPGRMLQHLDQTAGFDADHLQILVLDEADRIMDMGFKSAVDALVDHLPKTRQTLMFSATQSKKVSDLARLSLKNPEYVSVHEAASTATPNNLQQHYIMTPLPEKLDTLYGFIKSNLKSKMIVFLSSGKQVRFIYESIRQLQPGIPLLHLHGRQRQVARLEITARFTAAKHSCLFATDVVARGIDFPAVDWVIQADCPEDVDTYIHRVGRTARYQSNGRAVLFLDPSEEHGMIKKLELKKIPVQKDQVKENKKRSIKDQLQKKCFQNPDLKYLGQKAFISYTRAIYLRKDKDVFQLSKLDLDGFAASLGLPGAPRIKFQKGEDVKKLKNAPRAGISSGSESDMDLGVNKARGRRKDKTEVRTKYDKMFERQNQDVLSTHYSRLVEDHEGQRQDGVGGDNDDNILAVKRRLNADDLDRESAKASANGSVKIIEGLGGVEPYVVDSKRREKALQSKKKMLKFKGNPTKLVFDDEGQPHAIYELQKETDFKQQGPAEELRRQFMASEAARVREMDVDDKQLAKQRRRDKRDKRKAKEAFERGEAGATSGEEPRLADAADGASKDPLALLRSLPTPAARYDAQEGGAPSDAEPPAKRARKWFENVPRTAETEPAASRRRLIALAEQPETLEDLEALVTGLLDG